MVVYIIPRGGVSNTLNHITLEWPSHITKLVSETSKESKAIREGRERE